MSNDLFGRLGQISNAISQAGIVIAPAGTPPTLRRHLLQTITVTIDWRQSIAMFRS